jgi:hypothetical protein
MRRENEMTIITTLGGFSGSKAEYELHEAKKHITELEAKLADYKDDISKVLDEKCPSDERHCGCVPILRQQIDKYQKALVLITTMRELSQAITIANNALNERGKYPLAEQSVGDYWVGQLEQLEAQLADAKEDGDKKCDQLVVVRDENARLLDALRKIAEIDPDNMQDDPWELARRALSGETMREEPDAIPVRVKDAFGNSARDQGEIRHKIIADARGCEMTTERES